MQIHTFKFWKQSWLNLKITKLKQFSLISNRRDKKYDKNIDSNLKIIIITVYNNLI